MQACCVHCLQLLIYQPLSVMCSDLLWHEMCSGVMAALAEVGTLANAIAFTAVRTGKQEETTEWEGGREGVGVHHQGFLCIRICL